MPDIKTDPTLAEWIGIHDQLLEIEVRLQRLFEVVDELGLVITGLDLKIGIVADREY